MQVVIVAAVGSNGVIGADGGLPWRIPEDLARFKQMTMGGSLVMGRVTFESIGHPLPGRINLVLTRNPGWSHEGVEVVGSLDQAIALASSLGIDLFVAGGAEVYRDALARADRMELTEVEEAPDGDTFFPEVDWERWQETARRPHDGFAFVTYERV